MSDTDLLNKLAKAGNVTVWHGYYQPHGEARKDLVCLYRSDDEGNPLEDEDGECELSRGETLREAIRRL